MHEPIIKNPSPREVVVDVLATTLYEMLATGWQPRPAAARRRRPGPAEATSRASIEADVNQRRPGR